MTSKYSIAIDGKQEIYRFKTLNEGNYAFYLGDLLVGQVYHLSNAWTCISNIHPRPEGTGHIFPVHGFKARLDAVQFLISYHKIGDFYKHKE